MKSVAEDSTTGSNDDASVDSSSHSARCSPDSLASEMSLGVEGCFWFQFWRWSSSQLQ